MLLHTQAGDITEDRDARGWWLARPEGDTEFVPGFISRCAAAEWLRAVAHARRTGQPVPRIPAASTAPLFAPEPFVERMAR